MQLISKYKKIIMLGLALAVVVLFVVLSLSSALSKAKPLSASEVFSDNETSRTYVDPNEFLSNYETFAVYLETNQKAYKDENGEIVNGKMIFKIAALKKDDSNYKSTITVAGKIASGIADYISEKNSTNVTTTGTYGVKYKPGELEIINISEIFPAKGLWFTSEEPTLYLFVTWSEAVTNKQYYTYLEFTYDEYNIDPVEIVIKAPETKPTEE